MRCNKCGGIMTEVESDEGKYFECRNLLANGHICWNIQEEGKEE